MFISLWIYSLKQETVSHVLTVKCRYSVHIMRLVGFLDTWLRIWSVNMSLQENYETKWRNLKERIFSCIFRHESLCAQFENES